MRGTQYPLAGRRLAGGGLGRIPLIRPAGHLLPGGEGTSRAARLTHFPLPPSPARANPNPMLDALAATPLLTLLACFALAYLLGSIPFGLVVTKAAGAGDIRKIGSGNIGMTNVLRTGRKDLAALTLLGDAGKGWAAVAIAALFGPGAMIVAAVGAFLGHLYPVWLRGRGGKGVATYLGHPSRVQRLGGARVRPRLDRLRLRAALLLALGA